MRRLPLAGATRKNATILHFRDRPSSSASTSWQKLVAIVLAVIYRLVSLDQSRSALQAIAIHASSTLLSVRDSMPSLSECHGAENARDSICLPRPWLTAPGLPLPSVPRCCRTQVMGLLPGRWKEDHRLQSCRSSQNTRTTAIRPHLGTDASGRVSRLEGEIRSGASRRKEFAGFGCLVAGVGFHAAR